jgi:hypothetical protein
VDNSVVINIFTDFQSLPWSNFGKFHQKKPHTH